MIRRRPFSAAALGICVGAALGQCAVALATLWLGKPVVPVAQMTLTVFPAALFAAFAVLQEIEA